MIFFWFIQWFCTCGPSVMLSVRDLLEAGVRVKAVTWGFPRAIPWMDAVCNTGGTFLANKDCWHLQSPACSDRRHTLMLTAGAQETAFPCAVAGEGNMEGSGLITTCRLSCFKKSKLQILLQEQSVWKRASKHLSNKCVIVSFLLFCWKGEAAQVDSHLW